MANLSKRIVDAAQPRETDYLVWCGTLRGFGLRVFPSGRKTFVAQVRVGRATRRVKIGQYGAFTVDQAREEAQEIIRAASKGRDPQREKREKHEARTVGEVCDAYLEAAGNGMVITRFGRPKKLSTVAVDEGMVARHIKPLIGALPADELTRADVQRMADDIAKGKTAGTFKGKPRGKAVVRGGGGSARRVVELIGGIYTWAEKRGHVSGLNPARGVDRLRSVPRDRVLSEVELAALGEVLDSAPERLQTAATVIRLIALTGMRSGEACGLRWSEIDELGQCLRLAETKTGRSMRPMGRPALKLLLQIPRVSSVWVFPNGKGGANVDLKKDIAHLFDSAGLRDARSHDLRRTYASMAADEGYADATIAALLGHAARGVTARHYIRRPDEALVAAADRTAARIAAALSGG